MTGLVATANGFASLLGLRLLLGMGEAPAYPTNAKVASEWFPVQERGIATAIFDIGTKTGTAFALPLVAYIIAIYGWRASFVVTGLLGIIWTIIWYLYYRPLRQNRHVSQAERDYIEQGGARLEEAWTAERRESALTEEGETREAEVNEPQRSITWGSLFGYRTVWGMMIGFFSLNFVIYFFITWFPTYLIKARHFSLLSFGLYGMIPPLCGILGELLGGFVSDRLLRRGVSLTAARKIPIVIGMLLASVIALAVIVPSAGLALGLLSLSYAATVFAAPSVWSLPADVAPLPRYVASLGGIQNFASNIAGILLPIYTGIVLQATNGSFVIPLVTAGAFAVIGALSYLFIVGRVEPLAVKPA
jgi:ACS family D-galactonate transporter-like MFS transporter